MFQVTVIVVQCCSILMSLYAFNNGSVCVGSEFTPPPPPPPPPLSQYIYFGHRLLYIVNLNHTNALEQDTFL